MIEKTDLFKELIDKDTLKVKNYELAYELQRYLESDHDFSHYATRRFMSECDYRSELNHAIREGKIEGQLEKAVEIAKKMLRRGTPIQYIVEDTGLSENEIEKLCNENEVGI